MESVTLLLLLSVLEAQTLLGSSYWPAVWLVTIILMVKPVEMRPVLGWHLTTLSTLWVQVGLHVNLFIKYWHSWIFSDR